MKYQEMLNQYLEQKKKINSRYSLRAFAGYLGISASKLSEIMARKKALSVKRALVICQKLGLDEWEKNLFILSIQAQHSKTRPERYKAEVQIEDILTNVSKIKGETTQRAAWYFGAVEYILKNTQCSAGQIQEALQITPLQYENATRLIKRVGGQNKNIKIEPISSVNKWLEVFVSKPHQTKWSHIFCNLTEDEQMQLLNEFAEKANQLVRKRTKNSTSSKEDESTQSIDVYQMQLLICKVGSVKGK